MKKFNKFMSVLTETTNKFINIFVAGLSITIFCLIMTVIFVLVASNFETVQFGNW